MNLFNKSIFALSAVGMLGLWSCSSEETLQGGDVVKGQQVPLTITVNRGDARTRTILSENEAAGLDSKWVEGDKVFVYNTNGIKVGDLALESVDPENPSVGVFSGEITAEEGSVGKYAVWHFDESQDFISTYDENSRGVQINLSTQNFASVEALSAMDVLGTGDANDMGAFEIAVKNGVASVTTDVTLDSKLAMARFSLSGVGLPEGTVGTLNIYNADGTVNDNGVDVIKTTNRYRIIFSNGDEGQRITDPAGITVENAVAGQDVFVAFAPGDYRLGFNFTTADGEEFVCEYANSTKLTKGVYYNNGVDAEGNVLGAPLYFKHKDGRDDKKTFLIQYVQNLVDEGGEVTAEDRYEHMTEAEMEFIIKNYEAMFPENPLDENLYTFKHWSREWSSEQPRFDVDQKYTLRYKDDSTAWTYTYEDGSFEPMVWIRLYACWDFHYTLNFELQDDVVVEGAETLNRVEPVTNAKHHTAKIVNDGISVTRPGYKLLGWNEKDTEYFFIDTVELGQHKVSITLVPVWEKLPDPKTVSTSGYGHGDFN